MRKQRQRAEVIYSDTACVIIYLKIFQRNRQHVVCMCNLGFPNGSDSKESACSAKDLGLILGSGRSPGEGNGYPLQYSCLENLSPWTEEPGRLQSLESQRVEVC